MTKMRFVAWVLALTLIFQMLPAAVMSEEISEQESVVASTDVIEAPDAKELEAEAELAAPGKNRLNL